MFSFLRSRKTPRKEEPEPAPQKPGPAERNLSEQCGITTWSSIIDWENPDDQQADLDRRLALYEAIAMHTGPATTEGTVPCQTGTSQRELGVRHDEPAKPQGQQGKQPLTQPTTTRSGADMGVNAKPDDQDKRETTRTSGGPATPPVPPCTTSARRVPVEDRYGRVIQEDARYVNQPNAETPKLTRHPAMRRPPTQAGSTRAPVTPAPYSAPSTTARFTAAPASYPAKVPRWMDPHKVEVVLAERELARRAGESSDDAWVKRRKEYARQVVEEETAKTGRIPRQMSHGNVPNVADKTRQTHRQTSPGGIADVAFGGEHPTVAFARSAAEQDYQRRQAHELDLVDPDTVPIDTSWQERTYSGRAVGAAWVKLEKERGGDEPTHTSAVPSPLTIQKSVTNTRLDEGVLGRHVPKPPSPYSQSKPSMSYCHAAGEYLLGLHLRSLERGCTCQYSSVSAQRDKAEPQRPTQSHVHGQRNYVDDVDNRSPGPVADNVKTGEPRVHFSLPPHPRYNTNGYNADDGDDDDNRDRGGSDSGSSDSDILAPARPRRF